MEIKITCSNIFMNQGLCAIRDPELFVLNYQLPVADVNVELYFTNVKENPQTWSHQAPIQPELSPAFFDDEHIFMNDLWSIVAEPFFSMLIFSLIRSNQGNVTDRCKKINPQLDNNQVANSFLSTLVMFLV